MTMPWDADDFRDMCVAEDFDQGEAMPNVKVIIDGREHFSRDVDSFECEECVDGTFTASATFPPIEPDPDWRTPTGAQLDALIRLV